ncbi:hypothetical protein SAMN04489723_11871 [Algoriphagus aquimarinus]|uniref:Uncharacterized protein n=1 Tax=Algoriphagus aquimarinus TaxID=237018 RepID=A0A1I1C0M1_9BACT|nr:hypothetical protein SAMN04489723_11871 [Algoriphagus aquimarinus]
MYLNSNNQSHNIKPDKKADENPISQIFKLKELIQCGKETKG